MEQRLPAMQETQVRSLGWEDPLEKEMATHSSTVAWKIPWTEQPSRLQSTGSQRVRHNFTFTFHFNRAYFNFKKLMIESNQNSSKWLSICSLRETGESEKMKKGVKKKRGKTKIKI